ncbi:asparagine synthase-related protein [Sphingomonas sp. MMS24-J45]|uniref:asparagine synthase-related protein n=1 Tax=Sphingomonas sp. MMS24-J45 TaxID=3238806 RepID=UPI00384F05B3
MSAIFGILRFDGGEVAQTDLTRLQTALKHHALDGATQEALGPIGLGACIARVNREDVFEAQPLHDDTTRTILVADARLDNREDLATALAIAPAALATMPDSALILAAYRKWGETCAEHMLGDFTAAIWDGQARRLLLLRDHTGQRAVFYHLGPDFIAFASELRALWALPDVPRELPDAMVGRLLIHAMDPRPGETLYPGISCLAGGHRLAVALSGTAALHRYWTPAADPAHLGHDEEYYIKAYREVLGEAVACRIRRLTAPPGLQLSGGYDSSAIAGLAGPILAETNQQMVAASSVMPVDYSGTIRHAGRWIDLCERDMPWLRISRVTREGIDALTGLDARLAAGAGGGAYGYVHDALFAALAAGGARLMMDGHGGDYTLNPRGQAAMARFLKTGQFRRFVHEVRAHRRMTGASWRTTIALNILPHVAPWALPSHWRERRRKRLPWADQPIHRAFAERLIADGVVDPARLRTAERDQTDMRRNLSHILDRVISGGGGGDHAARHGLTLTRPFHDKRVFELALAIPEDLYLREGRNRYLACRALADVYPVEFQTRHRRNDDEIPDFQAMMTRIKPRLLEDIARLEQSESLAAMIDFAKIRRLLDMRGPEDHNSGWEEESQVALGGYMTARMVEAFRRDNK